MQFPITIELHRSHRLSLLLAIFHALAVGCVIALPWPWLMRSALLLLIGVSLVYAQRKSPIRGLYLRAGDGIEGLLADGSRTQLVVRPDSTVFSRMIVLRVGMGEARSISNLVLLPDQMSAEQFRVLRIWLRWRSQPRSGDDAGSAF